MHKGTITFSILAQDPETGAIGGAAATGNLCVGGWMLRGDLRASMSAGQGAAPSTFWDNDVLAQMHDGFDAETAVARVTGADTGRHHRQLAALDLDGGTGVFTGAANDDAKGGRRFPGGVVSGNMLTDTAVLDTMAEAFLAAAGPLDQRLLAALVAAGSAGGDFRGLMSAALLVLAPDGPPDPARRLPPGRPACSPCNAAPAGHDRSLSRLGTAGAQPGRPSAYARLTAALHPAIARRPVAPAVRGLTNPSRRRLIQRV